MKTLKNHLVLSLFSISALLISSCSSDDGVVVEIIEEINADFIVTNSGATAYIFNNDVLTNSSNPDITLERGKTYTFAINAPGHPFLIKSVQSTGTADTYNNGVTNNGTESGTITFTVPDTAPDTLFYNCEFHGVMTGQINIIGGNVNTAINYDVTNSGATAYVFNSNTLTDSNNPDLTLERGKTYTFTVDAPGHPFLIKSVQGTGTGDTYDNGVTNNGIASGTITFVVPDTAPDTLFYNCEFHGSMTGTITIID
ncbi:hypothetical protein [Aquimarina rubra]|uniref:EfeO-type cupredoxin-like domain-containing protein n=1 Tax=Aquimarina rubra TaxID=1920033 RepID=A0ABW5LDY7_9FLAO